MYSLLKMWIFQPAMLDYRSVPKIYSTNPGLSAKELDVSSILKQCRICGTLVFTASKTHELPRNAHYRLSSGEILRYFMGYLDVFLSRKNHDRWIFVDVCWNVCFWHLWIISPIYSLAGKFISVICQTNGVAFWSNLGRDMINVKMVDWPTCLNILNWVYPPWN